jgi:hypothetical protein
LESSITNCQPRNRGGDDCAGAAVYPGQSLCPAGPFGDGPSGDEDYVKLCLASVVTACKAGLYGLIVKGTPALKLVLAVLALFS